MTFSKFAARRRGFTLIEMLIVIVVIAILALIVIPRIMGAARRAKESTLRGNLHEIRTAIGHFEADCGCFPTDLDALIATTAPTDGVDAEGETIKIPENSYEGPYLSTSGGIDGKGIPVNPFAAVTDDVTDQWNYENGTVSTNAATDQETLDKVPYTDF